MLNNLAHVCVHYYAITDFWAKYGKTHYLELSLHLVRYSPIGLTILMYLLLSSCIFFTKVEFIYKIGLK